MPMLAEVVDAVVGGDTHRDVHFLEMVTPAGITMATTAISNSEAGFADALTWIVDHAPGSRVVVALEGTRGYGIGLTRALQAAGLQVIESEPPRRGERRRGKSDPIDAHLAAIGALGLDTTRLPTPRTDGDREALRILLGARQELTTTRTRQINRLRALLLTGDDTDRTLARTALTARTLTTLAQRRARRGETREHAIRRGELRRLARSIHRLDQELTGNKRQLSELVTALAPSILETIGVGPVSAAQAIVSWSHPGRCRNDAAYAALAGASPIPASSGRTVRHRLNRGGDRALNNALHAIMLTRWRACPRTKNYITKRRNQGTSDREIRRLLKRHIARELYRKLNTQPLT
jgi:transposase